jgi:GAF domain-containing protein
MSWEHVRQAEQQTTDQDTLLAQRLVALADTLGPDFELSDAVQRLVDSATELLSATEAALLFADPTGRLQVVAASSERSRLLGLLQLQDADGGPGIACIETGRSVRLPDLAGVGQQWPSFAGTAIDVGIRSAYVAPLRLRSDVIGSLCLHGTQPSALSPAEEAIAQALADAATIGILQQRARAEATQLAEQLQTALRSRVVIEQAKGVLAERGRIDMESAFAAIRAYSRNANIKLGDVAASLVARDTDPLTVLNGHLGKKKRR